MKGQLARGGVLLVVAIGISLMMGRGRLLTLATAAEKPSDQTTQAVEPEPAATVPAEDVDPSPVDFALAPDESWMVVANQTSNTLSLVDLTTGQVLHEVPCGQRPTDIELATDGHHLFATASYSGELIQFAIEGNKLHEVDRLSLGFEPWGVALTPDGTTAYVALAADDSVGEVDLAQMVLRHKIPVGKWPRFLALSADAQRLAVGVSGDGGVSVIDTKQGEQVFQANFVGMNLGRMWPSKDGQHVYFPWIAYLNNPITEHNIRRGWVLASRIARVNVKEHVRREAISLDPPGEAVADPHAVTLNQDESWMVATGSGTHELLVYRMEGLPWQDYGGPGDHLAHELRDNPDRFSRIELGGRPMAVQFCNDGRRVWVANYLLNAMQEVDVIDREVLRTIELGGPETPSLARAGEAVFLDARKSLDQWYSCYSCHYEGGPNRPTVDTRNDGGFQNTYKTIRGLYNVAQTGPWTWHGWQEDFRAAMKKSLAETLMSPDTPRRADMNALIAYFESLTPPPNWHRNADGSLPEAAQRGKAVFEGEVAGCANCHNGPEFTDGEIHDVGTGEPIDKYDGYNTPSLIGVARQVRWLHHGHAETLEELLTGEHAPAKVTGNGELSPSELADLIAYLNTL